MTKKTQLNQAKAEDAHQEDVPRWTPTAREGGTVILPKPGEDENTGGPDAR